MRASALRRLAGAAAAMVVLGAGAVGLAGPASAAEFTASCTIQGFDKPLPDFKWNAKVTYSPSSPKPGDSVQISVELPEGYLNGPAVAVKPGQLTTKLSLDVGGTSVQAEGKMSNTSPVAPNAPISFGPSTGSYTAKAGSQPVKITKLLFDYLGSQSPIDTTCIPKSQPVQATIVVTSGGGGSSPAPTQTTSGNNNNANAGGNQPLPHTGPDEAITTLLVAVVVLQIGLVFYVRQRRRPALARSSRRAH
ncbi:MAG TPA: hypothetical protein VFN19_05145 [Candidatus Nanopelagicales bacterium]|nr:hypothetical protein [Candidatus Nanopelagicales bacterium]